MNCYEDDTHARVRCLRNKNDVLRWIMQWFTWGGVGGGLMTRVVDC